MAFNFLPESWGGDNTNKDYHPLMQGTTAIDSPISLNGHTIGSFSEETIDALKVDYFQRVGGVNIQRRRTARPERVVERSFTMQLGTGGQVWTPLKNIVDREDPNIRVTIYANRDCPAKGEYAHTYIWPDCTLGSATRANDLVAIQDSGDFVDESVSINTSLELLLWAKGANKQTVSESTTALYGVTFLPDTCGTSSTLQARFQDLIAVGGDGTGALICLKTSNRFANTSVIATGAPTGSIGNAVLADESGLVLVPYSDALLATAATGGIVYSQSSGDANTWADASMPSTPGPIWDVAYSGSFYIAVGGATGAQATAFLSSDGTTWTALSSGVLPSTSAALAVDFDVDAGLIWIACEDGKLLKGTTSGNSIALSVVSLPGTPSSDLNAVRVLSEGQVAVGGASGYYAESVDEGATWTRPGTSAGTDAILAIGGEKEASYVGSATKFDERSVQTNKSYSRKALESGATISGAITDIAVPDFNALERINYAAFVTNKADGGEIVMVTPFYPNA